MNIKKNFIKPFFIILIFFVNTNSLKGMFENDISTLNDRTKNLLLKEKSDDYREGFLQGESYGMPLGKSEGETIGYNEGLDIGRPSGHDEGYRDALKHGARTGAGVMGTLLLSGAIGLGGHWLYNRYFVSQENRIAKSMLEGAKQIRVEIERNSSLPQYKRLTKEQIDILKNLKAYLQEFSDVLKGKKQLSKMQYEIQPNKN